MPEITAGRWPPARGWAGRVAYGRPNGFDEEETMSTRANALQIPTRSGSVQMVKATHPIVVGGVYCGQCR